MNDYKHYKPGDPEFEEIAKTVTHVSRVKKISQKTTYIDADTSVSKMSHKRRGENVNHARG